MQRRARAETQRVLSRTFARTQQQGPEADSPSSSPFNPHQKTNMPKHEKALSAALTPLSELIYAVLRIVSGAMFAFHGVQKVLGLLTDSPADFGSQMCIGGVIELVGGLMIALGFWTRTAAFLCSGTMAVAYFQFHWKFQFDEGFLPIVNQGEMAVLYCFVFLFIASRGAGVWAIDRQKSA